MPGIYFGKFAIMKPQKSYSLDQIKSAVIAKGYKWFETGNFNLNLIGIRNSTGVTNTFDDTFFLQFQFEESLELIGNRCIHIHSFDRKHLQNTIS